MSSDSSSSNVSLFDTLRRKVNIAIAELESETVVYPESTHRSDDKFYSRYSEETVEQNFDSVYSKETEGKTPVSPRHAESKKSESHSKRSVSRKSSRSSVSSIFIKQRAETEAATVRLKFAEIEAELVKQQAALQADLKILSSKRDVDEAEAKLQAINDAFEETSSNSSVEEIEHVNTMDRTAKFVADQNELKKETKESNLNPGAGVFIPKNIHQPDMCADFTKFIVKKDLLLSRLTRFNDSSEFFASWESTFKNVMSELDVTPMEELDLLVKWLGTESSKFAQSIRAANAVNPQKGLDRIWERLHERYACPEMIEHSLKQKLSSFPRLTAKDNKKLYDLTDIVSEIESFKENAEYSTLLSYFDSSAGIIPIVSKLPHNLQEKWKSEASRYKRQYTVSHPPFTFFAQFIRNIAKTRNDPSFAYESDTKGNSTVSVRPKNSHSSPHVVNRVTGVDQGDVNLNLCPMHGTGHVLNKCRAFRLKPLVERKEFIRENGICFRCCGPKPHISKFCKKSIKCGLCNSNKHPTALHGEEDNACKHGQEDTTRRHGEEGNKRNHGQDTTRHGEEGNKRNHGQDTTRRHGEEGNKSSHGEEDCEKHSVRSSCTQVCKNPYGTSKSCAKTVRIKVYPEGNKELALDVYAIIDDQSNRTLARSSFFSNFNVRSPPIEYALSSCSGITTVSGRRAAGFIVESFDGQNSFKLPTLIECDQIPNIRSEIPSPEVAMFHSHLRDIADFIPEIDNDIQIMLLIGRHLLPAHYVLDQRIGPPDSPYAQKLQLGWVIIGEACLGGAHKPETVVANKTCTLRNGRTTLLEPCTSEFHLKDQDINHNIFAKTKEDNQFGMSIEEKQFVKIMESDLKIDSTGKWSAPLPFRRNRPRLPDNRSQALRRAKLLDISLRKNPTKKEHMIDFTNNVLSKGYAEVAPRIDPINERWYLPLFGVYHPKKPDRIRCVFDSSAKHEGLSLNDVLLTGPDLVNSLLGVLLRFRKHPIAVMADIEQMFYCFAVTPEHRDFFRFMWYRDNNPDNELMEYRMTVHVFGNSPSPTIATFGLRKSVHNADIDVKNFVPRNFYVDDGLISCSNEQEAISLLKRTQHELFKEGQIRLHKIASNNMAVLSAFPHDDLAKDIRDVDLGLNDTPLQRSLGFGWNVSQDTFSFRVSSESKPFTKRGILSTINSLYDPIGFVAPVILYGKILVRDVMRMKLDWDEQLPCDYKDKWDAWREYLKDLEHIHVPQTYTNISFKDAVRKEVHIFADASKEAIGAVAYMKIFDVNGASNVGFILGKAKVAPTHGHTIPRLELCAAVLAVELKDIIFEQLDFVPDSTTMYSDSKVIVGYINNEQRRFYVYVTNRIDRICCSTTPDQWRYVSTNENPADLATRSLSARSIQESIWLHGPEFLSQNTEDSDIEPTRYDIVNAELDTEVRPEAVNTLLTGTSSGLGSKRFERFSTWKRLVDTFVRLKHITQCFNGRNKDCRGWHLKNSKTIDSRCATEKEKKNFLNLAQYLHFRRFWIAMVYSE